MNTAKLQEFLSTRAAELDVVGAVAAILHGDTEEYATVGVTSVENPLPVTLDTLFQIGSISKTYTATALVRLAEEGSVDLDAPVRRYVPELKLHDETAAATVTVRDLLTHTSGWEGDFDADTGEGDDALERYLLRMPEAEQLRPVGTFPSYSNSGFSLAGLVIERVTGTSFETAINDLLLTPLGMNESFWFATDIMTRRFMAGHVQNGDDPVSVARPWQLPRSGNPAGGIVSTVTDQLKWARYHLGQAAGSPAIMSAAARADMHTAKVALRGSALGEAIGHSWFISAIDGVTMTSHGGTTHGHYSEMLLVPEHNFALVSNTNTGPNGIQLNQELIKWALEEYLGLRAQPPQLAELAEAQLEEYTGTFETGAAYVVVGGNGTELTLDFTIKEETLAELGGAGPEYPTFGLAMLAEGDDEYVFTSGPTVGIKGFFERDAAGEICGVDVTGRVYSRTNAEVR